MKFSLIQVCEKENGAINGWWVQDHHGTLETVLAKAKEIEAANSSSRTMKPGTH